MARKARSFAGNWILYASLKHAQKTKLFRGQRRLSSMLNRSLNAVAAPHGAFGRQLRLLRALRQKRRSTEDLCKLLKVSRRTFFRDLATIRQAGIPIESDGQHFCLSPTHVKSALGQTL